MESAAVGTRQERNSILQVKLGLIINPQQPHKKCWFQKIEVLSTPPKHFESTDLHQKFWAVNIFIFYPLYTPKYHHPHSDC